MFHHYHPAEESKHIGPATDLTKSNMPSDDELFSPQDISLAKLNEFRHHQSQPSHQEMNNFLKFLAPSLSPQSIQSHIPANSKLLSSPIASLNSPKGLMSPLDCASSNAFVASNCFGNMLSLPPPAQTMMTSTGYLGYPGMPLGHTIPGALGHDDLGHLNAAAAYNAVSSSFVGRLASKLIE